MDLPTLSVIMIFQMVSVILGDFLLTSSLSRGHETPTSLASLTAAVTQEEPFSLHFFVPEDLGYCPGGSSGLSSAGYTGGAMKQFLQCHAWGHVAPGAAAFGLLEVLCHDETSSSGIFHSL